MRHIFIILLLTLTVFSGCSGPEPETAVQELDNLKRVNDLPPGLSAESSDKTLFNVDTEYLKSTGTPDEVIEYAKNDRYESMLTAFSDTEIFYFVSLDIMKNYGTSKYKIYRAEKSGSEPECIYTSEGDTERELYSAAVYNNCLYWSENNMSSDGSAEWFVKKLDLSGMKAGMLCSYTDTPSGIVPVLSSDRSGLYWYAGTEVNGGIGYNIMRYNDTSGIEVLFENVICNNPYTKYVSSHDGGIALTDSGFTGKNISLPVDSPELIPYYSSSDRYIVWTRIPEKDNYTAQILYIYDIEGGNLFSMGENELCGQVMGCGIIKNYIYINISGGTGKYNGMYLLDPLNNTVYDLNGKLNYETVFSWPVISENGELYFYGEKIYKID